ncbi:hypothetical protein BGW38_009088 [Lunasporangiospora selenospora]|uniref:Secreted protein n=1 Tax=Lunasporangiospora selenospora TaxID=979761 RepID=A0A9P6FXL9_9FUNG|nr:hypothetical protein BGW38_009088 [Lunasporangiospora selenospora]
MVKFISVAAAILPAILSVAQGAFILSSGIRFGTHVVQGTDCKSSTSYTGAGKQLKAGKVFCSYLSDVDMSLCQCHQADVSVSDQNGFTRDILNNIVTVGICSDNESDVNYASGGTWFNGFYQGNKFMSAMTLSQGKVTFNDCKPMTCKYASEGRSWRHFNSIPKDC